MSVSDVVVVRAVTTLTMTWKSDISSELARFYGFELDIGLETFTVDVRETQEFQTHQFSGLQPDREYSISLTIYRVLNGSVQLLPESAT